ncbi:MAG: hypothetical protein ABFC24_05960 [Methanoregulaceae archaeon]
MIFPPHCKLVGQTGTKPCGEKVYFLSRYLLRETDGGYEVLEVDPDPEEKSVMRSIRNVRVLAASGEVSVHPVPVQIHDRARLVQLASESGKRCTVFTSLDENMTFVLDPDPSAFQVIHIYDIVPPRPVLSATIRELESVGLFGDLGISFEHHVRDIASLPSDVFPCRAAGFYRTLDRDELRPDDRVAGCMTGRQLYRECCGREGLFDEICPLASVDAEPFIARCCRSEREGIGVWQGKRGVVVHWGASPSQIADAVRKITVEWRSRNEDCSR